jgi:hypothetical protein
MAERISDPRRALDYPRLPDDKWVIWYARGGKWPAADRETHFLTDLKRDAMRGYALFNPFASYAETFDTEAEARAWLAEQQAKRPSPYGAEVTTVAEMKIQRGYA